MASKEGRFCIFLGAEGKRNMERLNKKEKSRQKYPTEGQF